MATRIHSVAAGRENSQHLQMLVAGCKLMPAQTLSTPDVSAETDEDGAERHTIFGLQHLIRCSTPPSEFTQNHPFQITFVLFLKSPERH